MLRFPAGATLFASGYDAYELAPQAEQRRMLGMQVEQCAPREAFLCLIVYALLFHHIPPSIQ